MFCIFNDGHTYIELEYNVSLVIDVQILYTVQILFEDTNRKSGAVTNNIIWYKNDLCVVCNVGMIVWNW